MLVLSRKKNEWIVIGEQVTITVVDIRGDRVRLGIEAPKEVAVHRREVREAIDRQNARLENSGAAPLDGHAKPAAGGSGWFGCHQPPSAQPPSTAAGEG